MKSNMIDNEVFQKVRKNINKLSDDNVAWSVPVSKETIEEIKNGKFQFQLTDNKIVPADWFPSPLTGAKVLCLAGAGGQQAPYLAAAGAEVTVFDLSENMLCKDEFVAKRDGLKLEIRQGNMCDLSVFEDESFDVIVNPVSLMYVPDVSVVYRECYRVLKKNGVFISAVPNTLSYLCDYIEDGGYYKVCNKLPYRSSDYEGMGDWIEYGHTLESIIGGQISCGFVIAGFFEDKDNNYPLSAYSDNYFVTRALKVPGSQK